MSEQFVISSARRGDIDALVAELVLSIDPQSVKASLGFLYVTEALATSLDQILQKLGQHLEVQDWIGTVGLGICYTGTEIYDEPAAVIMLTQFQGYEAFAISNSSPGMGDALAGITTRVDSPGLGIIHGNPAQAEFTPTFQALCDTMSDTFFVGGLGSTYSSAPLVLNQATDATIAGVLFEDSAGMIVSHTQGCTPLQNSHVITRCEQNLVIELDHRPALEVLKEDIGDVLARDIEKIGGYIFVGFPVPHTDKNDYLVRNILGIDLDRSIIAVGEYVEEGRSMMFCRRDGNSAVEDLQRMLRDIGSRISGPPRGALYFSCIARGRSQFGDDSVELKIIQQQLGDIPLVGFFANGEILHNRLYGYTGVLTLFT
ncbi:MAG: FIST C-terminal domain-containing protein [Gammaproteobacteria bacterium]